MMKTILLFRPVKASRENFAETSPGCCCQQFLCSRSNRILVLGSFPVSVSGVCLPQHHSENHITVAWCSGGADPSRPATHQRYRELDVSGRECQGLEGWDSFHVVFWIPAVLVEKEIFLQRVRKELPAPRLPPPPGYSCIYLYDFEHMLQASLFFS